ISASEVSTKGTALFQNIPSLGTTKGFVQTREVPTNAPNEEPLFLLLQSSKEVQADRFHRVEECGTSPKSGLVHIEQPRLQIALDLEPPFFLTVNRKVLKRVDRCVDGEREEEIFQETRHSAPKSYGESDTDFWE